ncbi:3-phosphoserine/phosphohydroxythreonine transaminase [Bacillota bacterium Meth-B3]
MGSDKRVFNFAPGPATMPLEVLERAAAEMTNYGGSGMSVMEMSHRGKAYQAIFDETVSLVRELMALPDEYEVLLLQGGATAQFAGVPMNLMTVSKSADYIDSGNFAHSAIVEAGKYGHVRVVASSREQNYAGIPRWNEADFDKDADYFYITTNNTIYGTRFTELPNTAGVPLVADASSNILSEVYDITKFGVMYAGAQKNIGPAGVTLVVVRRDLLGRAMEITPNIMNWKKMADAGSMINTPPTYAIYLCGLCLKWLKAQGGVAAIEQINIEKAKLLYDCLDGSRLFKGVAEVPFRSRMNVTFRTGNEALDDAFVKGAAAVGLSGLKGHRAAGGMRASIYNAMPIEGVRALVDYMQEFERRH